MSTPRVVLADEQAMLCDMAARILQPEFEIAGIVHDGRSLLSAATIAPDVVVLDVTLPLGGVDAIRGVLSVSPQTKVIVLTMIDAPNVVREALAAGATGYVLKTAALHELSAAIREVLHGNVFVTPSLAAALAEPETGNPMGTLTPRERQVLVLLAEGRPMREVAAILAITPRTIAFHKYRIMKKLGVQTSAALIRVAISRSLTR